MYNFVSYWAAKMEMVRLWTTDPSQGLVKCAACGRESRHPVAHHIYLSRRNKKAKNDIRNIVPVCRPNDSPKCHASRVYGWGKETAANRHFRILGSGDPHKGRQIVVDAVKEWGITHVAIPQVREE